MSITKYATGSVRELMRISLPLMLSSLSMMTMLLVDRKLLSDFSIEAFNATVSSSTLAWAFIFGWVVLAGMSEVFVAQYNGAKEYEKIGRPVWQMIWVSLASTLFFVPVSIIGSDLIYGSRDLENAYFRVMMYLGFSMPLYSALTGFYVGRGKVMLITALAVVTNLLNIVLDLVLIFGIEGYIPSYGVAGAAAATCTSQIFQAAVLFSLFLRKKNRIQYQTGNWRLDRDLLARCLKIALPGALTVTMEIFGWAVYYELLSKAGPNHLTIAGICQSLAIFLWFFPEGLQKGIATLVGNLVGAREMEKIGKCMRSGYLVSIFFFIATSLSFLLFGDWIILKFFDLGEQDPLFLMDLKISLQILSLIMLVETVRFVYVGVLTATGDTMFLMLSNSSTIWLLLIVPLYFAITHWQVSIVTVQLFWLQFVAIVALINYLRYSGGQWMKKALLIES